METISESALTFLINAAWQIPAIVLIAALAAGVMRNGPAAYRHVVWVAALIAAVVLPFSSISRPKPTASLHVSIPAPSPESMTSASRQVSKPISTPAAPEPLSFSKTAAMCAVFFPSGLRFVSSVQVRIRLASDGSNPQTCRDPEALSFTRAGLDAMHCGFRRHNGRATDLTGSRQSGSRWRLARRRNRARGVRPRDL